MTLREFHFLHWSYLAVFGWAMAMLWVQPALTRDGPPVATELIMVEEFGCRFCRRFDAEVASAYSASAEGRFAPLRRLRREAVELAAFKPVVYTPTFILIRNNHEIGRITGYPGDSFFWEEIQPLLKSAGYEDPHTSKAAPAADQ